MCLYMNTYIYIDTRTYPHVGFPCVSAGKESASNARDLGSIPELGRTPEVGKGYSFQYSGLENFMDSIVHGVAKSWKQLSDFPYSMYSGWKYCSF